jgi:hypothetical protein
MADRQPSASWRLPVPPGYAKFSKGIGISGLTTEKTWLGERAVPPKRADLQEVAALAVT